MESRNRLLRHQLSVAESKRVKFYSQRKTATEASDSQVDVDDDVTSGKACKVSCSRFRCNISKAFEHVRQFAIKEEDSVPSCEVIHIAIVCAGHNNSRSAVTVVKSVLFYRKHPVHFHFLTNQETKYILDTVFRTWMLNQGT